MRRHLLLPLFCLLSAGLCAQQNPKENADVLVNIRVAGMDVPTTGLLYFRIWEVGQADTINANWTGAGTGGTLTQSAGMGMLMKPNRHYQAILSADPWSYGEIKFSAPAGYSIWIDDRPATTARVLGNPFLVAYKIELRPANDASMLPAGEAIAPRVGDLVWAISAGRHANGLSAGSIQWRAPALSAGLLDPTSLNYLEPDTSEVQVVRHSDGALLELRTFQFLLYVRRNTTAGTGYDIEIYDPYVTRTSGSGDGPYAYDDTPYRTYRVSNPNGSTWNNQIKIERIDTSTETWDISQSGSNWTVVETSSLRTITRTSTGSAPRVETVEVKDNANTVSTKLRRSYQTMGWGQEELVEEIANPDATNGPALTTTYTYHTTAGTGGYGRLKSVTYPDGSWVRYDYDDSFAGFGNLIGIYSPWQDSSGVTAANATTTNCVYTALSYTGERNVFNELPAGSEVKVLGTTTAKNTVSYAYPGNAPNGNPLRTETVTTYTASAATLTSTRTIYNPTAAAPAYLGRPYAQTAPDGTKVSFLRYQAYWWNYGDTNATVFSNPSSGNTWGEYRFSGFSTAVQDSVAVTSWDGQTIDTIYMVPNRSTVQLDVYDDQGRAAWRTDYVFTGASGGVATFQFLGMENFGYWNGLLHVHTKLNGFTEINWISNGLVSGKSNNDGSYGGIGRDALGRPILQSKDAVAASGEYPAVGAFYVHSSFDASGRVLNETVTSSATNSATSDSVTTARVYNLAGQLVSETAESGSGNFTTTYAYTNGGRTVTATYPGGATKIADNWIDGSLKTITGTGTVSLYQAATVNGDGTITRTSYSGPAGPSSPRWSKVTTDWAGRKLTEESPAPPSASPSTFTRQHYYNSVGQLIKTTEPGLADSLVAYNAWQQPYRAGLDLNANGTLDPASTDRITETDSFFEQDGAAAWWAKTVTKAYNVDSSGTPITTSSTKTRLNKYTPSSTASHVQTESVSVDIFGNETRSTVTVERGTSNATRLVTQTIDYSDSTTDGVTVTRNGLVQKQQTKEGLVYRTYYDSRSRPIKTTDPRTDTSTTARLGYVSNSDRVAWRQDNAGNQTGYTYESATGRLATTTDPLGKVARYAYTTRGETHRTWGDTTYPVEYAYNDYGEQVTMNTYRGGSGWTGTSWPGGTADTTTWAFDPATGTLTSKTDASSHAVAYTYTTRGQIKTRTWARGVSTTYSYSATTGEQTGVDYSDSTPDLTYTYNRLGQNLTVGDVTGTRSFIHSTSTTQLLQEDLGSFVGTRSITYGYDTTGTGTKGRLNYLGVGLTSSPGGEYNFTYGYDTYGRMNQVWTFTYTYLANSNLIASVSDSASAWTQTRTYESNRDLLDVIETKWSATSKTRFDYDSDTLGRRTTVAKTGELYSRYSGAGLDTTYGYNDRSELTSEVTKLGGTSTVLTGRDDAYAFDNIGNRTSATHNGTSAGYTANNLNQYTQRVVPGNIDVTGLAPAAATITVNSSSTGVTRHNDWYFKGFGLTNTSASVWQSLTVASSYGGSTGLNAFVPLTPEAMTYDLDGNLTSDGRWDYTYDAENRLIAMQTHTALSPGILPNADARRIEFKNDYLGRRVQKTVRAGYNGSSYTTVTSDTKYLYNGWNLLREMDVANGLADIRSFVWGLDWSGSPQGAGGVGGLLYERDEATATNLRPAYDGNGNLAGLVDAGSGSLAAAYEYDAFGNTLRATGTHAASNPFRFSTKYTDTETSLIYYGLRYYSPTLGRFINRDPIAEQGGLNLYGFVGNNAINSWDYLGNYQIMNRDAGDGFMSFVGDPDASWTRDGHKYYDASGQGYIYFTGDHQEVDNEFDDGSNWNYNMGWDLAMNDIVPGDPNAYLGRIDARNAGMWASNDAVDWAAVEQKEKFKNMFGGEAPNRTAGVGGGSGLGDTLRRIPGVGGVLGVVGDVVAGTIGLAANIVTLGYASQWHYSRNAQNDAFFREQGLYGRSNITEGDLPENRYRLASGGETELHRIGPGNNGNLKYTTPNSGNSWDRYGTYEIVVRPNGDGTFTHVTDPINMGTMNRGSNPVSHTFLDVVPYLIFGNTPPGPRG